MQCKRERNSGMPPPPADRRVEQRDHAPAEELLNRTRWIITLRWIAVVGIVAGAFSNVPLHWAGFPGVSVQRHGLLLSAAAVFLYNLFFLFLQSRLRAVHDRAALRARLRRFANLQIAADLVMITVCLHFSGGAENPFVMFYVFHVIIASTLLTRRSSYLQSAFATALFTALVTVEAVAPGLHHCLWPALPAALHTEVPFLFSEVVALGVTLIICAYLAHSIAAREHERELELEAIRDDLQRRTLQLSAANTELARLQDAKSHFLQVAAHQLRSPLAAIVSCLSTIEGGFAGTREKERDLMRRAAARSRSLGTLVADLLKLSQARSVGIKREDMTRVPFDRLVERAVELHRPDAEAHGLVLEWYAGCGDAEALANERALADVMGNLLSNAIKYTPAGGKVTVKTAPSGAAVQCRVTDTGIGIPKDQISLLFNEFFRARNAKRCVAEGTGLGLAIAKEIVVAHGGRIEAASLSELGTRFIVELPAVAAGRDAERTATSVS